MSQEYIHGYSDIEQQRLITQAYYWQDQLILRDLNLSSGESFLEIGCGIGAVLGIILENFPDLKVAGIDIESAQIEYARQHLHRLGFDNKIDLRVGNASQLPWPDSSFDCVYTIWFLEHVANPQVILEEAYRVLKPGGRIILNETDYKTQLIWPDSPDYQYLLESYHEMFLAADGNPYIGRVLGPLLTAVGFREVTNIPWAFYHFGNTEDGDLQTYIDYIASCIESTVAGMVQKLGKDSQRLEAGLEFFRNITNQPDCAAALTVYRASGRR
ncbi:class I SAM-dependent methyltransferase [Roseofilum casamattae]|uniref:Methyltransferase domain-containing protein n=1 Tax=Roseofilum casamattae BLCC-M143 TaxID=3022442 RepID=A0ABT7BRG7_9CYAN|nr:methyltransferase domain-containing protein [Roseofilum casamattae]MDJ1181782.1 methyltransferase domain-containing protein [Roseofilum casamattae BLCC-M143]